MADAPFIKFYPSDFLAGTSGLSPAERGVYITLLCLIFENDGPVTRDDGRLARRCGLPKGPFRKILGALMDEGKIIEADGSLSNSRAEKALIDRHLRSKNGTHAATERWREQKEKNEQKQGEENASAYADALPAQCVGDASQKPEPESREIELPSSSETEVLGQHDPPDDDDDFSDLLEAAGVDALSHPDEVQKWLEAGVSRCAQVEVIREVVAKNGGTDPPVSFRYFSRAMDQAAVQGREAGVARQRMESRMREVAEDIAAGREVPAFWLQPVNRDGLLATGLINDAQLDSYEIPRGEPHVARPRQAEEAAE